jgi:glutaredoxin
MAKEYFTENNVAYTEYDVAADEVKRNEMITKTGQMGVPVIMIGDEGAEPEIVVGFDRPKLAGLLGL